MNTRFFFVALIATLLTAGINNDASAQGGRYRGCRPGVTVRICPPPVRYCPPPIAYFARPRYAHPRHYAARYPAPNRYYHNRGRRCR